MFQIILKDLRTYKGLTQAQLAKIIGVTQSSIYFWESGTSEPTTSNLVALAKYFEVTVDELLGIDMKSASPLNIEEMEFFRTYNSLTKKQKQIALTILKEISKL